MANIKISELNELTAKEYTDYIPIVDTSADETKKISVENLIPSNVNLIEVSDTAPVTYETGDKYFNTETNKIYTATSSGWANAEDPISNILYIVLEEQKSYTYDGETLVSVGGGSGSSDIVMVQEEPTEDTKLVIEDIDLDGQYTESDYYSTEETLTNKVWIDGKPIYRKVIRKNIPNMYPSQSGTTTADGNIAHDISNLDEITHIEGKFIYNNNDFFLPIISSNGKITGISGYDSTNIVLRTSDSWGSGTPCELIIEYTKTTD